VNVNSNVAENGENLIYAEFKSGYWLALLLFAISFLFNGYEYSKLKKVKIKDGIGQSISETSSSTSIDSTSQTCSKCNTNNRSESKFYVSCGENLLKDKKRCLHCKSILNENTNYCIHCGQKLER